MNPSQKEDLARDYLPVVRIIVHQEKKKLGITSPQVIEELDSYAMEGLATALDKFDPERKVAFPTYADKRVRGAIYDGLSSAGWFPRRLQRKINFFRKTSDLIRSYGDSPAPNDKVEAVSTLSNRLKELATAYVTTYAADTATEPKSSPADVDIEIERREFREQIVSHIEELPRRQKQIVSRYFFEEQNLEKIASELGISTSWTWKLLRLSLNQLRESFGTEELLDAMAAFSESG